MPTSYHAQHALLPDGWANDVTIDVSGAGDIIAVVVGAAPGGAEHLTGPVMPGLPNAHSHAFQRAMAGLAEGGGDFWGWRSLMYRFLDRLEPDDVGAIAAQVYLEMLKAGYTAVGEFHYLHHDHRGVPYADPAEMAHRVIGGARRVGIGMTLLPVLYSHGGFGGQPPAPEQARLVCDPGRLLGILESLLREHGDDDPNLRFGIAPHSLRAVAPEELAVIIAGTQAIDRMMPVHIHVAEQTGEVDQCLAWCGARPVEWLLSETPIDGRWCLVHATHMTDAETRALAASDAVAGLCPTTEANLGDGLFNLPVYLGAGGKFAIGSDSHVSVSPWEELRWLEYGQRLVHRRRHIAGGEDGVSVGAALVRQALDGGAQALGRPVGRIEMGSRADLLVLDHALATMVDRTGDAISDAAVFSGNRLPVRDVMVGGAWVVRDGRHGAEEAVGAAYRAALARLNA